jgi:hypothetical protein
MIDITAKTISDIETTKERLSAFQIASSLSELAIITVLSKLLYGWKQRPLLALSPGAL